MGMGEKSVLGARRRGGTKEVRRLGARVTSFTTKRGHSDRRVGRRAEAIISFHDLLGRFQGSGLTIVTLKALDLLLLLIFIKSIFFSTDRIVRMSLLGECTSPNGKRLLNASRTKQSILKRLLLKTHASLVTNATIATLGKFVKVKLNLLSNCCNNLLSELLVHFVSFVVMLPTDILILILVAALSRCGLFAFVLLVDTFD